MKIVENGWKVIGSDGNRQLILGICVLLEQDQICRGSKGFVLVEWMNVLGIFLLVIR